MAVGSGENRCTVDVYVLAAGAERQVRIRGHCGRCRERLALRRRWRIRRDPCAETCQADERGIGVLRISFRPVGHRTARRSSGTPQL